MAETLARGAVPPDDFLPAELLEVEAEILAADVAGAAGGFLWVPCGEGWMVHAMLSIDRWIW